MVITNLFAVAQVVCGSVLARHGNRSTGSNFLGHMCNQGGKHWFHVFRQIPAVGAGIGHQFLLIQRLGIIQGLLRRKPENTVCIPLQAGQIVEKRRPFGLLLAFYGLNHSFPGLLAFGQQLLCHAFFLKALAGGGKAVHCKLHGVEGLGLEGRNFRIPHHHHCQSGGHDTAHIQGLVIQA